MIGFTEIRGIHPLALRQAEEVRGERVEVGNFDCAFFLVVFLEGKEMIDELKLAFALRLLIVMPFVHQGGGGYDKTVRLEVTQPALVRLDGAFEIAK